MEFKDHLFRDITKCKETFAQLIFICLTSRQQLELRKEHKTWHKSNAFSFSGQLHSQIALTILGGCTDSDEILVWCNISMEIIAISYFSKA